MKSKMNARKGKKDSKHSEITCKELENTCNEPENTCNESENTCNESENTCNESKNTCKELKNTCNESGNTCKEPKKTFGGVILNIILLALSNLRRNFLPPPDGDFDEWQKNFIKRLSTAYSIGGGLPILREYLGIPDADWFPLLVKQDQWNTDFGKGGKEVDRTSGDATTKVKTRKEYEKMIREVVSGFIRGNKKATVGIKRALKLTVPDTEPSPVHSTDAPYVDLKNKGGAQIIVRARKTNDGTRCSMLKDYQIEIRWWALDKDAPAPATPNSAGKEVDVFTKALFTIDANTDNLGKKFYCYMRWKHLHNPAFNGPWGNRMEIFIA